MKKYILLILSSFACVGVFAHIHGVVLSDEGEPLVGANVYWANSTQGVITDLDGAFEIEPLLGHTDLVASYMGYHADTTHVTSPKQQLTIVLVADMVLDEVTVVERKASIIRSRTDALNSQMLGTEELCKAACCNLSESFETNASVDVAYSDAATGAKQIRLLGLSGTYVQLLSENTPGVRGLAQNFGMEYIPGPWMESIQVSKGTSSVVNGYEATTGQINVEYLKPQKQQPIAVNAMLNTELHGEVNIEGGWKIPLPEHDEEHHHEHECGEECHHDPTLHTGLLVHYQGGFLPMDENHDGFRDMPLSQQGNILNRWYYKTPDYTFQFLARGLYDQRVGGTMDQSVYPIRLRTWRVDGFMKNGYVFDHESGSSIGIIAAASYHDQANRYGHREWNANQVNAYLNAMYQTNFEGDFSHGLDNDHKLTVGISLNYDKYNEIFTMDTIGTFDLSRWEVTPGVFAEYTLKLDKWLSMVAGVRADWSSRYGFFFTPRFNLRVSPWDWWTIRGSVGMGYRSPNLIADNARYLPGSRVWCMNTMTPVAIGGTLNPVGVDNFRQEKAVNAGVSTTFYIPMGSRELQLSGEYYFTNFLNCVFVNTDASTHELQLINLRDWGAAARAYSHNAQIEATMEILRGWTMTAAFRYTDVKDPYRQNLDDGTLLLTVRDKPLTNKFKGIITTSYQTPLKKWQFDVTAQFNGGGRMPDGFNDYFLNTLGSTQYTEKDGSLYYKWYPQLMAQITKYFRTCSLYLGAENMTNFRQENPIISADTPYDPAFDASMTWAPTTGWKIYLGFRWALDRDD